MSGIGAIALKAFEQIARGLDLDGQCRLARGNSDDVHTEVLRRALTTEIYSRFYIGNRILAQLPGSLSTPGSLVDVLLSALPVDSGIDWEWRVAHRVGTTITASRKGWIREFHAGDYLRSRLGDEVGFPIGVSQSHVDIDDQNQALIYRFKVDGQPLVAQQVRFYFHVKPESAALCLHEITHALADWDVPHSIKCPMFGSGFSRSDAMVVYMDRRDVALSSLLLGPVCDRLQDDMHQTTPLFALPLRPGVAFAESPRDMQSFGMSRSRHCAAALLALVHGASTPAQRVEVMIDHFLKVGISLRAPHLNEYSKYPYCFHELHSE